MRLSAWVTLRKPARSWAWAWVGLVLAADLLWFLVKFPMASHERIFSVSSLPVSRAPVLILGAGILPDREPSHVLQARLETGVDLYRQGKAGWFLVSGDNRAHNYNEPQAMRRWLLKRGIPPELVISDFAGRRTYDSLKRAQAVFGVTRVVVVTSDFHLARALFLARRLGLDAYGVPASTGVMALHKRVGFWLREFVARHLATWDAWFPPSTMLGPREPTPDDQPSPGPPALAPG
jgi:vancomycin permeability regulator SanA